MQPSYVDVRKYANLVGKVSRQTCPQSSPHSRSSLQNQPRMERSPRHGPRPEDLSPTLCSRGHGASTIDLFVVLKFDELASQQVRFSETLSKERKVAMTEQKGGVPCTYRLGRIQKNCTHPPVYIHPADTSKKTHSHWNTPFKALS
jgi:hypothetical protein